MKNRIFLFRTRKKCWERANWDTDVTLILQISQISNKYLDIANRFESKYAGNYLTLIEPFSQKVYHLIYIWYKLRKLFFLFTFRRINKYRNGVRRQIRVGTVKEFSRKARESGMRSDKRSISDYGAYELLLRPRTLKNHSHVRRHKQSPRAWDALEVAVEHNISIVYSTFTYNCFLFFLIFFF